MKESHKCADAIGGSGVTFFSEDWPSADAVGIMVHHMAFEFTITGQTLRKVLIGLLAAAVAVGLVFLTLFLINPGDPFGGVVDDDRIQSVFLQDGRVFFGSLEEASDDYYLLRNAYFVQQTPGEKKDDPPTQEVRARVSEVHGPEDRMLIAKDDVVIIENLSNDSELAKTIDREQEKD